MQKEFNIQVGLSDHTISNLASTVAIGMGAVAIEKHFKFDDQDCGPDDLSSRKKTNHSKFVIHSASVNVVCFLGEAKPIQMREP